MDFYRPLDAKHHDQLADAAQRESILEITFDNGVQQETLTSKVVGFTEDEEGEYIILEHNYMRIRLDHILSIDGQMITSESSDVVV